MKSVGELSQVCSQVVLKCLYLARIGRPDILWAVNKLARSKACDKRLNRLISYIHYTCEYKQYCHVGNTAKQCRLGLFQDSDFAGDLEDSKSTSGGTLCVFGSHTFVPTESEIISLDTGLRLDGLLVNIIPPEPEFHEQIYMTNGYDKMCTTTSTFSPILRPLWTTT